MQHNALRSNALRQFGVWTLILAFALAEPIAFAAPRSCRPGGGFSANTRSKSSNCAPSGYSNASTSAIPPTSYYPEKSSPSPISLDVNGENVGDNFPNLLIEVDRDFVAFPIMKQINRSESICDNILGASISGTAHTSGMTSLSLIPNNRRAVLQIDLVGGTIADTVGSKGPVRVYSNSFTSFNAHKRITINSGGICASPAWSNASTSSQTKSIGTKRNGIFSGLIRSFAADQVNQNRGKVNSISSQRAQSKLNTGLNAETDPQVADAHSKFQNDFTRKLGDLGILVDDFLYSTTSDSLRVAARQVGGDQQGPRLAPPKIDGKSKLTFLFHESAMNNWAASHLAGRTLTRDELNELIVDLFGKVPDQIKSKEGADETNWSITFADKDPMVVSFQDSQATFSITGQKFTNDGSEFGEMQIKARYDVEVSDTGSKTVMRGDLLILPPGFKKDKGARLSVRQQLLVNLLRRRFSQMMPNELKFEGLSFEGGPWESYPTLYPTQLVVKKGWLAFGWAPKETPAKK